MKRNISFIRCFCLIVSTFVFVLSISRGQELLSETVNGTIYKSDAVVRIRTVDGKPLGAGFIVKPSGLILTSYTVVGRNSEVIIKLGTGKSLMGKVIKVDRRNNLSLIKVEAGESLPYLNLGDSGTVRNIDKVISVGYPFNGKDIFFEGRICGIEKAERLKWLKYFEKIDPFNFLILFRIAMENPNLVEKGTPLLNIKGEVIGINVLTHKNGKEFLYAIAINKVFEVFHSEFESKIEDRNSAQKGSFEISIRGIRYAVYVPTYYTSQKKWPLILAFHPAGDGGEIRDFWIATAEREGFIVAAGYTFQGDIWNTYDDYRIFKMLKDIFSRYNVDRNRVYLTGLSGGAVFACYLGINYPEFFSAIASVTAGSISCIKGELNYSRNSRKHIPILVIHGSEDTVVPLWSIRQDVNRLRSYGYKVSFKEIRGMGHEHRTHKDIIYPEIVKFFNRNVK